MAEEKITLSKQDRRSVALRSTFLQGSWNYERMQNGGGGGGNVGDPLDDILNDY